MVVYQYKGGYASFPMRRHVRSSGKSQVSTGDPSPDTALKSRSFHDREHADTTPALAIKKIKLLPSGSECSCSFQYIFALLFGTSLLAPISHRGQRGNHLVIKYE